MIIDTRARGQMIYKTNTVLKKQHINFMEVQLIVAWRNNDNRCLYCAFQYLGHPQNACSKLRNLYATTDEYHKWNLNQHLDGLVEMTKANGGRPGLLARI